MTILSFGFYIIVGVSFAVYWLFPSRYRWGVLLIFCILLTWLLNNKSYKAVLLMYGMILLAFLAGRLFNRFREKRGLMRGVLIVILIAEAGIMLFLKDLSYFQNVFGIDNEEICKFFVTPLGVSYFTLSLIGYVLDCYWNGELAERNPFKFILFGSYFPILTSGPIIRYRDEGKDLTNEHAFSYRTVCFGLQRILWGMLKKLVLAERLGIIVNTVYNDLDIYQGLYIWIAVFLFLIQLYADFTGSMDIIFGVSGLYGIGLPENFNLPFVARNLSEFWRRWHITLGTWLKNYIFYPIIKSESFQNFTEIEVKRHGKNLGRKIPVWGGLFVSWAIMGLWHGGTPKFFFVTLWFWFWIVLGEALNPVFDRITKVFRINTKCFSWHLFQSVRTFILVSISAGIFRSESLSSGLYMYEIAFNTKPNPWILFDINAWINFGGLVIGDWIVITFCLMLICSAAIIKLVTGKNTAEWISEQNLVFRWTVWLLLFLIVLIWGKYSSEYNAADFIYKGF